MPGATNHQHIDPMLHRLRMDVAIGAGLLVLATVSTCLSRDHGQFGNSSPERRAWFEGLKSGKGPCCSDADGTTLADPDWKTKDGHYQVRIDNQWIDVPDEALIKEPNLYGKTMVWPIRGYLGISIRCFIPGPMT